MQLLILSVYGARASYYIHSPIELSTLNYLAYYSKDCHQYGLLEVKGMVEVHKKLLVLCDVA